eukprot:scaffold287133_cov35-Tisochrysis_lutea.AAC.4
MLSARLLILLELAGGCTHHLVAKSLSRGCVEPACRSYNNLAQLVMCRHLFRLNIMPDVVRTMHTRFQAMQAEPMNLEHYKVHDAYA